MSQVTLAGNAIEVTGQFPQAGSSVADFTLVSNGLENVSLSDFAEKRKVLNIFPSIDTGICATSVRVFNKEAAELANTVVLCISA
ncbi:redoxin family protein, partial [Glaesserella parasuis]|nr:redoxin family protein [Glaesserella parasuis]MDE3991803.1 redoxin family protein [Glaesserella parasuis]